VPSDARPVDGGDEARARLDETAREQMRLAPAMPPVSLADRVGFLRQIERLGGLAGLENGSGLMIEDVHVRRLRRHDGRRGRRETLQETEALLEPFGSQAGVEREVFHSETDGVR